MFCNCIEKGSYTKLNDRNQQKGDDSFCFTKIHETKRHCEYPDCIDCLLGKLEKENWKKKPENIMLKIAYENKIIKNPASCINELNKEDKKNSEQILALYFTKYEFC